MREVPNPTLFALAGDGLEAKERTPAHNLRFEGVFERQKRYSHSPTPKHLHSVSLEGAFLNKDMLPPK